MNRRALQKHPTYHWKRQRVRLERIGWSMPWRGCGAQAADNVLLRGADGALSPPVDDDPLCVVTIIDTGKQHRVLGSRLEPVVTTE